MLILSFFSFYLVLFSLHLQYITSYYQWFLMISLFRVSVVSSTPLSEASLHDSVSVQLTYDVGYLDRYKFCCLHTLSYTIQIYQSTEFNAFTIFDVAQQILLYRVNFHFTHLKGDLHHRFSHLSGPFSWQYMECLLSFEQPNQPPTTSIGQDSTSVYNQCSHFHLSPYILLLWFMNLFLSQQNIL